MGDTEGSEKGGSGRCGRQQLHLAGHVEPQQAWHREVGAGVDEGGAAFFHHHVDGVQARADKAGVDGANAVFVVDQVEIAVGGFAIDRNRSQASRPLSKSNAPGAISCGSKAMPARSSARR